MQIRQEDGMRLTTGKLIVIEGTDGTGKETQSRALTGRLAARGRQAMRVSYPRYDKDSSLMVRHYLAGGFGDDPDAVSPYLASTFYAADRYASYHEDLKDFLSRGGIVIADRYTTSNMVHQAGKIHDAKQRDAFLDWLWDFEFVRLGLPEPTVTFFLNMPPDVSAKLIAARDEKAVKHHKDIHETHPAYLREAYESALSLVARYGWQQIDCVENGALLSVEAIGEKIDAALEKYGVLS